MSWRVKNLLWSVGPILNQGPPNFGRFSNSIEIPLVGRAPTSTLFQIMICRLSMLITFQVDTTEQTSVKILITIQAFSVTWMHLKMSSAKCQPFRRKPFTNLDCSHMPNNVRDEMYYLSMPKLQRLYCWSWEWISNFVPMDLITYLCRRWFQEYYTVTPSPMGWAQT